MNTRLYFTDYVMPAANLGPENPLPDLGSKGDIHSELRFDDSVPEQEQRYFTYGKVKGILPYMFQDGYDRNKKERAFYAAILENDYLKAVFLPEVGGRLWSLYDKAAGRELLHKNPVYQPANLALRNAWFSGGVEWNIGMTGHTPFTASPLFTASAVLPDGAPVLRLYEWERIRRVSYQIDAYLPADSRFLYVRVYLCNTTDSEVPMYWWSNIAAPEAEDVRVIAPADTAYWFDYHRVISKRPVPELEGIDRSYTTRVPHSMDTFFDLKPEQRKWITAVDGEGFGLIQTSTDRLHGRKLFMWGNGPGGRHWQEFLSAPGDGGYLEIQAGLAKTQMQHIPMPANAQWEWLEAYGAIRVDPAKAHGEWPAAYAAVDAALEAQLPRGGVDAELKRICAELNNTTFTEDGIKFRGGGWGALEKTRLAKDGRTFAVNDLIFDDASMGEAQRPWLELLRTGVLPERDPGVAPAAYLVQDEWRLMLEESVNSGRGANWHAWLQLGVMRYAAGDVGAARAAFEASIAITPSAWACRNLSVLCRKEGKVDDALSYMQKAAAMTPILPIALEYAKLMNDSSQHEKLSAFIDACAPDIKANWRMRIMKAQAAFQLGDLDAALDILRGDLVVCDMREGEVLLSDMWVALHKKILIRDGAAAEGDGDLDKRVLREFPLPSHLDFRMRT